MNLKKIVSVCCISIGLIFLFSSAKATEECFERLSRSIFKFNIAFDNIVLEPIAKGYNKLPTPVRKGTRTLRQTSLHYYRFQILYYKVT